MLGHTDQYASPEFFSNWELSAARAAVVARYLVNQPGVDPCKISATGLGPYHPIDTLVAEANRRIEIQIVPALAKGGDAPGACYPRGDNTRPRPRR